MFWTMALSPKNDVSPLAIGSTFGRIYLKAMKSSSVKSALDGIDGMES